MNKKAENARELGLDYEPNIIEMARELGFQNSSNPDLYDVMLASYKSIEAFAELVREEERERIAKWYESEGHMMFPVAIPKAIRSGK